MNKITLLLLSICLTTFSFGQTTENDKLIELGKAYKDFMFRNEPPKDFVKDLQASIPENLKVATNFIAQTISTDNELLKQPYLSLPDNQSLKFIYIIRSVNDNITQENQIDNNKLIDSLKTADIPKNELVDGYYSMLFTGVGNKVKPFNFTKINFKLKDYNLTNETEK